VSGAQGVELTVTSDVGRIDREKVLGYLQGESYWARGRRSEDILRTLETSLCFSILLGDEFVGFARVITDQVTFNYLCDFFILPEHQNKGFGTQALRTIISDDRLSRGMWILFTKTAHEFYRRLGFVQDDGFFTRVMVKHRPE